MMAGEAHPTKVAVLRFRASSYPDAQSVINELSRDIRSEIKPCAVDYPVNRSDLKLYGKSKIDIINKFSAAIVFTFNDHREALEFYVESIQNPLLSAYVYMLTPDPSENGSSTAAVASTSSSPDPPSGQSFEERSLVVFGISETEKADTARKEIEHKLKQKKSSVIVQCVLGPIHSAEIEEGPDQPCMIITLADAADAPIVASVIEEAANQAKVTGHILHTQMIRESTVYLDPNVLREAAKVKHVKTTELMEHLVHKFGVTFDIETSEQRVKCSGHWIQIKQLEAYIHPNLALTAKSHEMSQSAAQSSPQAASHTEPHASPQMAPQSVPHSAPQMAPQAAPQIAPQMPLDTPDVEMAEAGGQMNPSALSVTGKTTVVRTKAPHSSGDGDARATAYANGRKTRTSSSPSPSRTTSSSSSPDVSSASRHGSSKSGRADKLQSSQSAGARPKEKTKKPIAVKKFVDTVPATEMHTYYLKKNSDILQPILKKIPDVSIEPDKTRGGFQVSAVTERDLARACSLLKDELQELEKITEQYDLSDEKVSAETIRKVMEKVNKKFPSVIMNFDENLQSLFICGDDALAAVIEVEEHLSASKTSKKDSVSEEIAVEKDIMNYILKVGKEGLMDFQKYNVKMTTIDTGDVIMCQFTGKKRDVSEAVEKMNKLVKKCTDTLASENVLFSATAYKSHHRQLEELEKQNQDKVVFCYSSDKTRLHLVGPQSAVQPIRESIESLLGTKRKRGSSLRRRKPKLAADDTESEVDRRKAEIARLSKTMGAAPSSTHTRRSPQKDTPKSYQYRSSNFIVHILQCDITNLSVDIVVNSSNSHLNHKHGVARCIAEKAGGVLTYDCNNFVSKYGPLSLGSVFVSSAGNLPCRSVMHAASPTKLYVYHGPIQEVMQLLNTCLCSAEKRQATSIAFPPIGAGVLGAPIAAVGQTFAEALARYFNTNSWTTIRNVYIVDITEQNITAIQQTFSADINMKEIPYCGIAVPTASTAMTRPVTAQPTRSAPLKAVHSSDRPGTALSGSSASSSFALTGGGLYSTVVAGGLSAAGYPGTAQPAARSATAGPSYTGSSSSTTHHPHFLRSSTPPASYPASSHSASASSMTSHSQTRSSASPSRSTPPSSKPDDCVICMSPVTDPKQLPKCKHTFCRGCIDQMFAKMKPVCPVCGEIYGKITGDQPDGGRMSYTVNKYSHLPGYEAYGTIVIDYYIPSGKQGPNHSNPGASYQGVSRTAYLPDNAEGQKVLRLLKEAFDARLMFTIGRSVTSGRENMVTWNDIHHKTSMHGGANNYGYPDPDYLKRVQEELAAKGIK